MDAAGTVGVPTHDIDFFQWAKEHIFAAVKLALIGALTKSAGGPASRAMFARLNSNEDTYSLVLHAPLHTSICDAVCNPEYVHGLQRMFNATLVHWLHAWGYRLKKATLTCPDNNAVVVHLELWPRHAGAPAVYMRKMHTTKEHGDASTFESQS